MTNTFVPNFDCPMGRTDTFTSQRREPSCILPLLTPKYLTNLCNSAAYSAASIPFLMSGSETISSKGTPALFRSTCETIPSNLTYLCHSKGYQAFGDNYSAQ